MSAQDFDIRLLKTRFSDVYQIVYKNKHVPFRSFYTYGFLSSGNTISAVTEHNFSSIKNYFSDKEIGSNFTEVKDLAKQLLKDYVVSSLFSEGRPISNAWAILSDDEKKDIRNRAKKGEDNFVEHTYYLLENIIDCPKSSYPEKFLLDAAVCSSYFNFVDEDLIASAITQENTDSYYESLYQRKFKTKGFLSEMYYQYCLIEEIKTAVNNVDLSYFTGRELKEKVKNHRNIQIVMNSGYTYNLGTIKSPEGVFTPYGISYHVMDSAKETGTNFYRAYSENDYVPYSKISKVMAGKTMLWFSSQ